MLITSPLSYPGFIRVLPVSLLYSVSVGLLILEFFFIAWSGYLWMHAMEKTHEIPRGKAMGAAAIMAVVYFLWPLVTANLFYRIGFGRL